MPVTMRGAGGGAVQEKHGMRDGRRGLLWLTAPTLLLPSLQSWATRLLAPSTSGRSRSNSRHAGAYTSQQAPVCMSLLREPIQGLTLPQDVPAHQLSVDQQNHDCPHRVVLLRRSSACSSQSRETEARGREANSRAGNTNIPLPKSQLPSPEQAPHLPPCPLLLTHQHHEDPESRTTPKHLRTSQGLP